MKDDLKYTVNALYFSFRQDAAANRNHANMKTKTTGTSFKDYGADSARAWGLIQPCHSTIPGISKTLFHRYSSPARKRLQIVYDAFLQFWPKERPFRSAFTTQHVLTFIQLPILPIARPKFPPGRYTRDARDDLNRCPPESAQFSSRYSVQKDR